MNPEVRAYNFARPPAREAAGTRPPKFFTPEDF